MRQTSRSGSPSARVVRADREQPRVLALRSRVRLQRDRVVAGDLGQPAFEIVEQLRRSPAACSIGANGWMRPNSGHVTGTISAVALSFIVHDPSGIIVRSSARSRSASRRRYRSIWCSERYRWNAGCVRYSDVRRNAPGSQSRRHRRRVDVRRRTTAHTAATIVRRRGLVERDAEGVGVDFAQVDAPRHAPRPRSRPRGPGTRTVSVSKNASCTHLDAAARRLAASAHGDAVHACRRSRGGPRVRGTTRTSPAITASSTCAVQMLLVAFSRRMCCSRVCNARRNAVRPCAVDRHADEPARQRALVLVARREERRVRPAEAERHAEPLRAADDRRRRPSPPAASAA